MDSTIAPTKHVSSDSVISGIWQGSVEVTSGSHLQIDGVIQGSLDIEQGCSVAISGAQQGSVHINPGATVVVTGAIQGSVYVSQGGSLEIKRDGKLAGSLHVDGVARNYGIRGGTVSGNGQLIDEPGSRVKQPVRHGDTFFYNW